jgi:hypothetical protein
MSVEDKMLARFAKEQRKKHSRSAMFNLDDDDDEAEEVLLTHNDKVHNISQLKRNYFKPHVPSLSSH